jgi:hypothetical protein
MSDIGHHFEASGRMKNWTRGTFHKHNEHSFAPRRRFGAAGRKAPQNSGNGCAARRNDGFSSQRARRGAANRQDGAWARAERRKHHGGGDRIRHDGKRHYLGTTFDDEHAAARAVDTAARRLRGEDAHGGQAIGGGHTWRLNFPTEGEVKSAQERGALLRAGAQLTEEHKAEAASERQGPSEFVGVSWHKRRRKWSAISSTTMGRSSTWAPSTTSTRRREPSTRRRGGCGARTRTADEQGRTGIG